MLVIFFFGTEAFVPSAVLRVESSFGADFQPWHEHGCTHSRMLPGVAGIRRKKK